MGNDTRKQTHHHQTQAPHCRWVVPYQWPGLGNTGCNKAPLSKTHQLEVHSNQSGERTRNLPLHA